MTEWWNKIKALLEPEAVAIYDELIVQARSMAAHPADADAAISQLTNEAVQLSQAISLRRLCEARFGDFK